MNSAVIPSSLNTSKREIIMLNIFWGGALLFELGSCISATGVLSIKQSQAIQAAGVVPMLIGVVTLVKLKMDSGYLRLIFPLLIIWNLFIIFRAENLSLKYDFFKDFFFGSNDSGLIYIAPFVLLFKKNTAQYKKLFYFITVAAILFFLLSAVFIKQLLSKGDNTLGQRIIENFYDLSIPSAFIILTYLYHTRKRMLIAIASVLLTALLVVVRARRGLIFISTSLLFFCILSYFIHSRKKFLIIYLALLFTSIGFLYANNLYNIANNKFIGFLYQRGTEDTRENVELYFYDDMKQRDWIIGRGFTGKYFCPDIEDNQETNYRTVIETGYLQVILKGGIVSLALLLLIMVPAIFLGIFYSNNLLSKAAAIWIFQFVIDLYPQDSVSFSIFYIMVWISVGICYSKAIRRMSNNELKYQLKLVN